jgi:hypothetical protein
MFDEIAAADSDAAICEMRRPANPRQSPKIRPGWFKAGLSG